MALMSTVDVVPLLVYWHPNKCIGKSIYCSAGLDLLIVVLLAALICVVMTICFARHANDGSPKKSIKCTCKKTPQITAELKNKTQNMVLFD